MDALTLTIDGKSVSAHKGSTILEAAQQGDIYIPSLCAHPQLPRIEEKTGAAFVFRGDEKIIADNPQATWDGCGLCAVEVDGEIVRSCTTVAASGMSIVTNSPAVIEYRRGRLKELLREHPHACLTCAQALGCSRSQCSSNVPENERCCELLGSCELQRVAHFIGVPADLTRYRPKGTQKLTNEPLYNENHELCIGCLRCVRACNDLRGVGALGFVMRRGKPVVGNIQSGGRVKNNCRFCGACIEVCPTGALVDKISVIGQDREKILVPCRNTCPAGIDIPRLLRHIARGEPAEAAGVIREKVPLAFSVSYACFHPCEEKCRRAEVNEPVSVCRLKRFAIDADKGAWRSRQKKAAPTGKRVAMIGSGPAGLTAAYYSALSGHTVTVYEMLNMPGGMLRVGVPQYRLPWKALDGDIEEIRRAGVDIQCSHLVDAAGLEKLAKENDAVFIASGAHKSKRPDIKGIDLEGVYGGVEFLRDRALGALPKKFLSDRRVIVIGGGYAVFDAARVARRTGAKEVCIVTRKSETELLPWADEIKEAQAEGVTISVSWAPQEIGGKNGKVDSLSVKRCTRIYDEGGTFHWKYDESRDHRFTADAIIIAIGQEPSSGPFHSCTLAADGTFVVDEKSLATNRERIFAGGDVVSGPKSIIEAIAMGRRAAQEIDKFLGGSGMIDERLAHETVPEHRIGLLDGFAGLKRRQPVMSDADHRAESFEPIEATFEPETARAEALRCLCCDLRMSIAHVETAPQEDTFRKLTEEEIAAVTDKEGIYRLFDADKKVIAIKGVMSLRQGLREAFEENKKGIFFVCEKEPMYTKRESELIQQYLQEHGELPGGGAGELDDLF